MTDPINYRIQAVPTTYKHIEFDSRLEARWAAFFDECGWKWVYHPVDLGGWFPDFALTGFMADGQDMLVEVKPLSEFDSGVWRQMVAATTGDMPLWLTNGGPVDCDGPGVSVGWRTVYVDWAEEWGSDVAVWAECQTCLRPTLTVAWGDWGCARCGNVYRSAAGTVREKCRNCAKKHLAGECSCGPHVVAGGRVVEWDCCSSDHRVRGAAADAQRRWAAALNATKYRPKRPRPRGRG